MSFSPAATDKVYIDTVASYVRGTLSNEETEQLLADDEVERLHYALKALKKDVESQLSAHNSRANKKHHELNKQGDDGSQWLQFLAETSDWRAKATKFLSSVEDHIAATKERKKHLNDSSNTDVDSPDISITKWKSVSEHEVVG